MNVLSYTPTQSTNFFEIVVDNMEENLPFDDGLLLAREDIAYKLSHIDFSHLTITAQSLKEKCSIAVISELVILNDILDAGADPEEMLKGAHFFINDNGQRFQKWSSLPELQDRSHSSSHHNTKSIHGQTDQKQYEISGKLAPAILFGQTSKQAGNQTWVQLEKTPFNAEGKCQKIKNVVMHGMDYLNYKYTGQNIGPFGTSVHTESNQINLNPLQP